MHFADRLTTAIKRVGNSVCVGIDPRLEELPEWLRGRFPGTRSGMAEAVATFGMGVIDVVGTMTPVVKFQAAFYESLGPEGMTALALTMKHARDVGLLVILDGKRNDIGSTAEAYARAYLGAVSDDENASRPWKADALTINPYLGSDGVLPFVEEGARRGRGVFALVRTSNPSAREFQDLKADGRPVYRYVAEKVAEWAAPNRGACGYGLLGAVVGATYPEELAELREALPNVWFLVPGYGAQGGSAKDVAPAFDAKGLGAIVNNSRGLIYAYNRPVYKERFKDRWQAAVEQATRDMIADLSANTPSGRSRDSAR